MFFPLLPDSPHLTLYNPMLTLQAFILHPGLRLWLALRGLQARHGYEDSIGLAKSLEFQAGLGSKRRAPVVHKKWPKGILATNLLSPPGIPMPAKI